MLRDGCVKVTVSENAEAKYTGLSKDELIKMASAICIFSTHGFGLVWLCWFCSGMLAGAIVIIVQPPRCKPIPEMNWWNEGFLYQISDVNAFSEKRLKGVEEKLDYMTQMKVKGLVLGPVHTVQSDQLDKLNLVLIKLEVGTENDLESLLCQAQKKVTFDPECFSLSCTYWLKKKGFVDSCPSIQAIFNKSDQTKKVYVSSPVSLMLNRSGVDLLLTGLPDMAEASERQAQVIKNHHFSHLQTSLGWCLSGRTLGSLASRTPVVPVRLYKIPWFTLPVTPVSSSGDEVGLKAGEKPQIMWDLEYPVIENNATAKTLQEEHIALRNFFKTLTHLRGKERSFLHGEYVSLFSSPTSLAFVLLWDQSECFLTAMNWGNVPVTMNLTYRDLPT
uniref:Zgc:158423 n=1 Tax=Cyprinus carpio TaxID=7962 RepID=A0A8C1WVK3_CYPCA